MSKKSKSHVQNQKLQFAFKSFKNKMHWWVEGWKDGCVYKINQAQLKYYG